MAQEKAIGPHLDDLLARRTEILRVAAAYGASNVRVFGSVARGDATFHSDIDLLVDIDAPVHGFDYFGLLEDLRHDLAELLARNVDVLDSAALHTMRERVLSEAVPL